MESSGQSQTRACVCWLSEPDGRVVESAAAGSVGAADAAVKLLLEGEHALWKHR